jgi:hypothetical protein
VTYDALAPYPSCDARVEVFPVRFRDIDMEYRQYRACCSNAMCQVMGPRRKTQADARVAWNKMVNRHASRS